MLLEIILAILIGTAIGIITGITPGVHVNLVSVIIVSFSPLLLEFTSPLVIAVCIISIGLTHTFLDALPSVFLGAPDPDMVLSVLPAHKLLLEGKGYEAVKLLTIGSFFCLLITLVFIPISLPFLEKAYAFVQPIMGYLLLVVVIWMILLERKIRKKFLGLYISFQSGVLGLLVFSLPNLSQPLLPMLSGLFGVSTLLLSLEEKNTLPTQTYEDSTPLSVWKTSKATAAGVFSGSLTGLFPGLGAAQASIIGSILAGRNIGTQAFLILVGGVNTVNFTFSLAAWYTIDKARNGAIVSIMTLMKTITFQELFVLIAASLIVGSLAVVLTLQLGKLFAKFMNKINYRKLCISIMIFVSGITLFFSGLMGAVVLAISTAIGLQPASMNVRRSHNMGCLLLPVILYFL